MENLDHDVLENILYRLPVGTASSQAKRVCRSWKTILANRRHNEVGYLFACRDHEDPYKDNQIQLYVDRKIQLYFGEEYDYGNKNLMKNYCFHGTLMEMEHCRFAYKYFKDEILVGSCNGLVCFQKNDSDIREYEPLAICNPLTGEFLFLKANLRRVWDEPKQVATGFGYCQSTEKYKVVRLYTVDRQKSYVQVYTIGSNEWRDKETVLYGTFRSSGIFANGVLHWMNRDTVRSHIAAFDLEDETFKNLPRLPGMDFNGENSSYIDDNQLKLLGGNLCWVQENRSRCRVDIWAYKRNNLTTSNNNTEEHDQKRDYYRGNSWNWVKEFSIETECRLMPFAITKSNQVLLLGYNNFYCYDPKTGTRYKLGVHNGVDNCSFIQAIPHANSYISLKDFGETWYGPGCSTIPQTNSSVLLTEVRDAYHGRKRKRQS